MIQSNFFTHFIQISNYVSLITLGLFIVALFLLRFLKSKGWSFSRRIMTALGIGLALGFGVDYFGQLTGSIYTEYAQPEISAWLQLVGYGFLRLLQLLAVPVVFLSIIEVLSDNRASNLKSLTKKAFVTLLGTTAISAIVGILTVNLLNIDASVLAGTIDPSRLERMQAVNEQGIPQFILEMVPSNILGVMSTNSGIVSVVIIAMMFAASIRFLKQRKPEEIQPILEFFTSAKVLISSVLTNVIKVMPYGVVALVANTIITNGISAITGFIEFIFGLYVAVAVMLLVYVVILLGLGLNPVQFYKKSLSTMLFAFSSRSSVGTLPYTLETLKEDLGVSASTADFVATMGTTIGMNGCAGIFPAMLATLLAKATGTPLDFGFYALLVVVVTLGSIGIVGVPGTATVAATVTLNGIGLGSLVGEIGAVFGIDPLVDMGRTMLNVTGSMVSAIAVDKWEGHFDQATYDASPGNRNNN